MVSPSDVLKFWLEDVGAAGWYQSSDALDAEIREKFLETWNAAREGALRDWLTTSEGVLAYIILLDQFPRNMFRGEGKAFSSDKAARAVAKKAIDKGWDLKIDEPQRQFFYLPLMHSENLCDQERCVRLMKERMPESGASNLLHAKAHREVIRQFGRFPYRNAALGRRPTEMERSFEADGGYGATVKQLQVAQ